MNGNSASRSHSLGGILASWAERHPEREAFSFLGRGEAVSSRLTYLDLHRQALAIMACLGRHGLAGRPVILIYPPGLDYIAAFCGCLYAGVIAVPAPYLLPKRAGQRIAAICRAAEPAAVLTLSTLADLGDIRDAAPDLAALPWIATDTLDLQDGHPGAPLPVAPTDPAFLQFTSGSTGTPKGVIVSHGNLMANMAMIRDAFGHDEHTRFVSWLPMFHDMGLVGCVLQPIYLGVSCVTMSPLSFLQKPVRWLQAIARHGGTTSGAPNFAYDLCARTIRDGDCEGLDLASWRVAFCGAEPVRPDSLSRFAARVASRGFDAAALYPCYGLSEATLFASGGPPATGLRTTSIDDGAAGQPRLFASSGTSWHAQEIAIVDPDSLRLLADGHIGEIWLAGPHIAQGYWNRPDETAIVFGGRTAGGDGRSYLRSGDLGFRRDGELYVTGRLRDLMIVRGAKHMPEDIEATVAECHPALAYGSGAAFTIDDTAETRIVILQEVDRRHLPGLDIDAVIGAAVAAVTGDHGIRPDDVRLLRPGLLPRTTSGKIQRHRCREAYLAGAYPALVCAHD